MGQAVFVGIGQVTKFANLQTLWEGPLKTNTTTKLQQTLSDSKENAGSRSFIFS